MRIVILITTPIHLLLIFQLVMELTECETCATADNICTFYFLNMGRGLGQENKLKQLQHREQTSNKC